MLATGATSSQAGNITFTADNTVRDIDLAFWNFLETIAAQVQTHNASITIGTSANINGGVISATATAGDNEVLANAESTVFVGQFVTEFISFLNDIIDLPISAVVKEPTATVTVDSSAQITGTGDVDLVSSSTADAVGEAIFSTIADKLLKGTAGYGGFAIGVSETNCTATTTVSNDAIINAGGSVAINSKVKNVTDMKSRVTQNVGTNNTNPNNIQLSLGVTYLQTTSKALVDTGAVITATGNVSVTAQADDENKLTVETASYRDGKVGITGGLAYTNADVEATVDGTINAGFAAVPQAENFNPDFAVDFADSSITFNTDPGYQTGDALVYSSGVGGAIPGLVSGTTYYAIANPALPDSVQLAATASDAASDQPIVFGPAYPTLSDGSFQVPITDVGSASNEIFFDYDTRPANGAPLFTEGEQVTYTPAAGNYIGYNDSQGNPLGALPAGTYTVHIVEPTADANNLYAIQLLDSNGNVVPLNINPIFMTAAGQPLQALSIDADANTVTFDPNQLAALGITLANGQPVTYYEALDTQVTGLTNGQTYYAIVDPANPGVVQLAATLTQAEAANPAIQNASPTLTWGNNQTWSIDSFEPDINALVSSVDPDITDGTPVVYNAVPGKPVNGLTDGATYYAYNQANPDSDPDAPQYELVLRATADPNAPPVAFSMEQTLTDSSGDVYTIMSSDAIDNVLTIASADGSVPNVQTGEALTFTDSYGLNDPGLIDGQTYYAAVAPSQPYSGQLLLALAATPADASGSSPNAVSLQQAVELGAVDPAYMSGTQQSLTPVDSSGITISATLSSNDDDTLRAQIGSVPKLVNLLTQGDLAIGTVNGVSNWVNVYYNISRFWAGATVPGQAQPGGVSPLSQAIAAKAGGQGNTGLSTSDAAALMMVNNTVNATVGPDAVLRAGGDVSVTSNLTEATQPQVEANTAKAANNQFYPNGPSSQYSIAAAVDVAIYNNTSQAVIDSNAQVDSAGNIDVNGQILYPWAWQVANPNGFFTGNNTITDLATLFDGNLGLDTWLVNSWADAGTSAGTSNLVFGASISWMQFNNTCLAQIAQGARINQDDLGSSSAPRSVTVNAQTTVIQVDFTGTVYLSLSPDTLATTIRSGGKLTNLGGVTRGFGASLGGAFAIVSLTNTTQALLGGSDPANDTPNGSTLVNFGSGGLNVTANQDTVYVQLVQAGGNAKLYVVSGSLSRPEITTTTTAQIYAGAHVVSDPNTSGDVNVLATDNVDLYSITGAVLINANRELDVSTSYNEMTRTVTAVIGDTQASPPTSPGSSIYQVGGAVNVKATATGVVVSAALAGLSRTQNTSAPASNSFVRGISDAEEGSLLLGTGLAREIEEVINPNRLGAGAGVNGAYGWGLSGDFSYVQLNDTVSAYVNDTGTFTTAAQPILNPNTNEDDNAFSVTSSDSTVVVSATGAAAMATSQDQPSLGLAGSASVVLLTGAIQAFIADAALTSFALAVSASRSNVVVGLAAGGSGSATTGGTAIAGSVAVAELDGSVLAQLTDVTATVAGDSSVTATDTTTLVDVAGALARGGKTGIGIGVSVNVLDDSTQAEVTDCTLTQSTGSMDVSASDNPIVISVAFGLAWTASQVAGDATGNIFSAAGMVAVNLIETDTQASMSDGSYQNTSTASGSLSLTTQVEPIVVTFAGSVDFGSNIGFGPAVAYDQITAQTNQASIDGTTVTLAGGGVDVSSAFGSPPANGSSTNSGVNLPGMGDNAIYSAAVGASGGKKTPDLALAVTVNEIKTDNTATIDQGANVTAQGAISVQASDGARIGAGAGDLTIAGGLAFGAAAIANNITDTSAASINDATVATTAPGSGVSVAGTESSSIDVVAVGIALDGSAIAGSLAINQINDSATAIITGSEVTSDGAVNVAANDQSVIVAIAGTFSLSAWSKGVSAGGGASVAINTVGQSSPDEVYAEIINSTVKAPQNEVSLTATSAPSITTITAAGAGSGSTGSGEGDSLAGAAGAADPLNTNFAISGAGAGSGNKINTDVLAEISDSTVTTSSSTGPVLGDGNVILSATNTAAIWSLAGGIAVSYAFGGRNGVAVTFGAAAAVNSITDSTQAIVQGSKVTADGAVSLTANNNEDDEAMAFGVAGALSGGTAGGFAISGAGSGAGNTINDTTEALIQDLAGSGSTPAIPSDVNSTGGVSLSATEGVTIIAAAGSLAISLARSSSGDSGFDAAGAIGVSGASNSITDTVAATISDSTVNSGGSLSLTASTAPAAGESESIEAVTVAGGVAVGASETAGIAFDGAGAFSTNTIQDTVTASIESDADVTTTGNGSNVSLTAHDNSAILADGGGATVSGEFSTFGAAVAIGAGTADNTINQSTTEAYIDSSTVTAAGSVALQATSTAHITCKAFGVAIAVAAGSGFDVSASGSGASGTNTIDETIESYIQGGSTVSAGATGADAVSLSATDDSNISCSGGAGSLSVTISTDPEAGVGASLAVGEVKADNTIGNQVEAFIGDPTATPSVPDTTTVTSAGQVNVTAKSTPAITAVAVAVAASITVAPAGASFSGSGANSTNTIGNTVEAAIQNGSTVAETTNDPTGDSTVVVSATGDATITATVGTGALAIGLVGASVGVSLTTNSLTDNNTVSAFISDATVTTIGQAVQVTADSMNNVSGTAVATSASVAIGGAGAGGSSNSTDDTVVTADVSSNSTIDTKAPGSSPTYGALDVTAKSAGGTVSAQTDGGSAGLGSIGAFLANASVGGSTTAYVTADPQAGTAASPNLTVGSVSVAATGGHTVTTDTTAVVVGLLAGEGTSSTTTVDDDVTAYLAAASGATASAPSSFTPNGTLSITATSTDTGTSQADGGLLGLAGISGNLADSTVTPTVTAYVADDLSVTTQGDMTVAAAATDSATNTITGINVSIYGVGVSKGQATDGATVAAYVGADTLSINGNLSITATSTDTASSEVQSSGGAYYVAADGAGANATINPNVQAYAGDAAGGADITVSGAHPTVTISARETPYAYTDAYGVTVSIYGAVGPDSSSAMISLDNGSAGVSSYVANNSSIAGGSLTVQATQSQDQR
ncbi:MAG: beta strand repeat-containing protein [Isosphaeraceae bacterium]